MANPIHGSSIRFDDACPMTTFEQLLLVGALLRLEGPVRCATKDIAARRAAFRIVSYAESVFGEPGFGDEDVPEPQHGAESLEGVLEHGQERITCKRCGRQWSVNGSDTEVVAEGDGYCDENPEET